MNNSYTHYYATIDSDALLAILHKPEEYQPEALEAARQELEKRNHTPEELEEMKFYITHKEQKHEKSNLTYKVSMLTAKASTLYRDIQTQTRTANLRTLTILATILAGISLWNHFYLIELLFMEDIGFDLSYIAAWVEALWLPVAALLLWRQHRAGWIMTIAVLTSFMTVQICLYMREVLNPLPTIGADIFVSMFPQKGFFHYFIIILFSGSFLAYTCLPAIRRELGIDRQLLAISLLLPTVLTFLWIYRWSLF